MNRPTTRLLSRLGLVLLGLLLVTAPALAADPPLKVVALGDSITKGVRPGVKPDQTFAAVLQEALRKDFPGVEVVNVGIGGERTDQALKRLAKDVIARKPAVVTIMYGANDCHIDTGKKEPRLPIEEYRANLGKLVDQLRAAGIKPVLMTEPRYGDAARPNGIGEHPNVRLGKYMAVCREVARAKKVPLVDHYEIWTARAAKGTDTGKWTTDQLHPNPEGHRILAETMLPAVKELLRAKPDGAKP